MNKSTHDHAQIEKAVDKVDAEKIEDNLQNTGKNNANVGEPENLKEEQKTPFIDEQVRTDD